MHGAAAAASLFSEDDDKLSSSIKAVVGDAFSRVGGGVSLGDGQERADAGDAGEFICRSGEENSRVGVPRGDAGGEFEMRERESGGR